MAIEESLFRSILVTKGRKTGKSHSVMLRAVKLNGRIYFSRHKPNGDWFQNAIANPQVTIKYKDSVYSGKAKQVQDDKLEKKISELKYPGEDRANEKRVVIEITLDEQQ